MSGLKGIGLQFKETMRGWVGIGAQYYVDGRAEDSKAFPAARIDAKIVIDDMETFFDVSGHTARLEGSFTFKPLGGKFVMEDGEFHLFTIDPDSDVCQMTYSFRFTAANGNKYYFFGHKDLKKKGSGFHPVDDMTTLFTDIYKGPDKNSPLYGKGQLFFHLRDSIALLTSMKVTGTTSRRQRIKAKIAFMDFAWGAIRREYLRAIELLYKTEYENLVLSGKLLRNGKSQNFFLVSGTHDKDFPWGDGETFWDVLLVIENSPNKYKRYAITDRSLVGLKLFVEEGTFEYKGPIYEVTDGYATSFTDIKSMNAQNLVKTNADFSIRFRAERCDVTPFPFPVANNVLAKMSDHLKWALRSILPAEYELGISITPHTVTDIDGSLNIGTAKYVIDKSTTFGEAEISTFRNIKKPPMLYGYICAISPGERTARVQIHSSTLRNERQNLFIDQMDALLGAFISRVASKEMLMEGGNITIRDLSSRPDASDDEAPPLVKLGDPLLEVNNDHYQTANFQRRIIEVEDSSGGKCLALEEDMDLKRLLEAIDSSKQATVACIKNRHDKIAALNAVLDITGFKSIVANRWNESGKPKDQFSIVIKPNFMFAYNVCDHSTYTDPKLVEHLMRILRNEGYENIAVVEAQSTYGEFFDKRSVREVAKYLGFSVNGRKGYKVIDLTLDQNVSEHLGPHLGFHPVPVTWKNADFRISFAKNKTHSFAYYTLTLKNIYGALAKANKYLEYHCLRDIYYTTMEYLKAFPIHYGLIDAYLSADGPFGIFADAQGNPTKTIIGGEDLVAVDWVGAMKMGLHPEISEYMKLAIKTFGKPKINLIGDSNPYRPWLNVPVELIWFTTHRLDKHYSFGRLIFMSLAYMDEKQFTYKFHSRFLEEARKAVKPIQTAVFMQAGGKRTLANKLFNRFETWLGSH